MIKQTVRTHVVLPRELVDTIDSLAGERTRSGFIEEALREKVARERMGKALEAAAGGLDLAEHPEWSTPKKVSAWVRAMRTKENEHAFRRN